jgi:hypothetical protein
MSSRKPSRGGVSRGNKKRKILTSAIKEDELQCPTVKKIQQRVSDLWDTVDEETKERILSNKSGNMLDS